MARKGNIRSIRYTDDMADLLDRQIGDTFQAKFEALVTRCMWELPAKEAELQRIDDLIQQRRSQLSQMSQQARDLQYTLTHLSTQMAALQRAIDAANQKWEV